MTFAFGRRFKNSITQECISMKKKRLSLKILPNLITLGNGICGFAAIIKIASLQFSPQGEILNPQNLVWAAWLILLGMVFDALDGKVARMTKSSSDFGAELDSLCDIITFGVAPAALVAMSNSVFATSTSWGRTAWVFSVAFVLGALLRLARFNVETGLDESDHEGFSGLPSPAAAGTIATLLLVSAYLQKESIWVLELFFTPETIRIMAVRMPSLFPVVALILAYLMVSRIPYPHIVTKLFKSKRSFDHLTTVIFLGIFVALIPEIMLALFFCSFAVMGPFVKLKGLLGQLNCFQRGIETK